MQVIKHQCCPVKVINKVLYYKYTFFLYLHIILEAGTKRKTEKTSSTDHFEDEMRKKPKVNIVILNKAHQKSVLLNLLANISNNWYDIGLGFGIDQNNLESIKNEMGSDNTKLSKVIECWISTQSSTVTWETVISVIEGPIVNNRTKANEIRKHLGLDV